MSGAHMDRHFHLQKLCQPDLLSQSDPRLWQKHPLDLPLLEVHKCLVRPPWHHSVPLEQVIAKDLAQPPCRLVFFDGHFSCIPLLCESGWFVISG
jgi:hypothetical protein